MVRRASPKDASAVAEIYNYYIQHTVVTFEETTVSVTEMAERIEAVNNTHEWVVFEQGGEIIGYAYASTWKKRSAYRFSSELTVYVKHGQHQKGIGTALYQHLIDKFKAKGIQTFIGGITLPNEASVALHEKLGFKKAAHYKKVGFKLNKWHDVGYWQRLND